MTVKREIYIPKAFKIAFAAISAPISLGNLERPFTGLCKMRHDLRAILLLGGELRARQVRKS